jgi:hypothetical protein
MHEHRATYRISALTRQKILVSKLGSGIDPRPFVRLSLYRVLVRHEESPLVHRPVLITADMSADEHMLDVRCSDTTRHGAPV